MICESDFALIWTCISINLVYCHIRTTKVQIRLWSHEGFVVPCLDSDQYFISFHLIHISGVLGLFLFTTCMLECVCFTKWAVRKKRWLFVQEGMTVKI